MGLQKCVADSLLLRRGQSASQSRNLSREVVGSDGSAKLNYGRGGQSADQVWICPETLSSLLDWQSWTADGPLMGSGQSAV